jgi:hypothetical protein
MTHFGTECGEPSDRQWTEKTLLGGFLRGEKISYDIFT